jgi:two-component system chemotaxis response regulator CheB
MNIRVVIADDSALARGLLRAILEAEPDIEVVGEAANGQRAVALAQELRPSLLTMDLEMPGLHGLEAIAEIMRTKAVPILVVSSVDDAALACEALRLGALEVIAKPDDSPASVTAFLAKVRLLANMVVVTRRVKPLPPVIKPRIPPKVPFPLRQGEPPAQRLVAIAASTGGPQALATLLSGLSADFPATILIAQHIAAGFSAGLAEWLGLWSHLPVHLAGDAERPCAGHVYLAPSERNLILTPEGCLALRERPGGDIYRPSCDRLLTSVAEVAGARTLGVILTGMSSDGVAGLARIHARGGRTLAQDEASSVVYGMNRAAIEAGYVDEVLPLAKLAAAVEKWAQKI